jgi:tetratricopeptide (TPR) repeat protein
MLGEAVAASLIASGIAESGSWSAKTVHSRISDAISVSASDKLGIEFAEELDEELDIEGADSSASVDYDAIRDALGNVSERSAASFYQERSSIIESIASELVIAHPELGATDQEHVVDAVESSLGRAIDSWLSDISDDIAEELILKSAWENQEEVKQLREQLNRLEEAVPQAPRYKKINVEDPTSVSEEVSEFLHPRNALSDSPIERPNLPKNLHQDRYLVVGRFGLGKSTALDILQRRVLHQFDISHVVLPREDFVNPSGAEAFESENFDGNVLLVWDDIHGASTGEESAVRESILRLSEQVESEDNTLYILASARSELLDTIEAFDRPTDRVWESFETVRLDKLSEEAVIELVQRALSNTSLELSDYNKARLEQKCWLADASPRYIESAINTLSDNESNQSIAEQISELPTDVSDIWSQQYSQLVSDFPNTRFILWSMRLLQMGGIPAHEQTLRSIYTDVFDRDEFNFEQPVNTLLEKQWIWEGDPLREDIEEPNYESEDAQMSAVDEDNSRVLRDFSDYLLENLPDITPDSLHGWVSHYHSNLSMFFAHELAGDTYDLAEPHVKQALDLNPYSPTIRNNYATLLQMEGRFEEAAEQYEMILSVAPDWNDIRNTYAVTLEDLGRFGDAIKQYERIIESEAPYPIAYSNLASLYLEMGNYVAARQYYETALSSGGFAENAYNNLGLIYSQNGDLLDAVELWEQGIEAYPENIALRINLSGVYLQLSYPRKALETVEPLLDLDLTGHEKDVYSQLALIYSELGDADAVRDYAAKAESAETGNNSLDPGFAEQAEIIDRREDVEFSDEPELVRVIDALLHEEDYSNAYRKCIELLDQGYQSEQVYLHAADLCEKLNRYNDAHTYYQQAIECGGENPRPHHHYGSFCKHQGLGEKAAEQFEKALEIEVDALILNDYALFLSQNGEYTKADERFSQALSIPTSEYPQYLTKHPRLAVSAA